MKTAHEFESTHAYVIHCLESSIDRKRRIALLRYELEHPAQITPREMIDVMNYSRGDCDDRTKVRTSNNSYYIAANYKENAKAVNESIIEEILGQLVELEQVQNRLEYYLSLLNWRERDILQMRFLEGWHIIAIAKKFDVTDRTIDRIKKRAIETLVEMYEVAHFRPCDGACYIAALATRRLYDENGVPHLCVDEEKRKMLEIKLITRILDFELIQAA